MTKKSKSKSRAHLRSQSRQRKLLLVLPLSVLILKIAIIVKIQGYDWYSAANGDVQAGLGKLLDGNFRPPNAWLGADGESYLRGLQGLLRDGVFSTEGTLSYWPAGYPILMFVVAIVAGKFFFFLLTFLQSALFAFACALFVDEIRTTRLSRLIWPIALILNLNPTIALNTIAIGYELPTLSMSLIAVSLLVRDFRNPESKIFSVNTLGASLSMMLAAIMQPRLILFAIVIFILWSLAKFSPKRAALVLASTLLITSVGPMALAARNLQANGYFAISTNLGTTMNIGAGKGASGGYTNKTIGVPCENLTGNAAQQDSIKVKCLIKWYLHNPIEFLRLSWNKSVYFWSPWVGPAANGTMARNPWRVNHPLNETLKTESGFKMVYGNTGKLISWAWMIFTLITLTLGIRFLWGLGGVERLAGLASAGIVLVNWLSAVGTIGDHRFRIPSMGMSLFLQAIGAASILRKNRKRGLGSPSPLTWPGLRWKGQSRTDNLPS